MYCWRWACALSLSSILLVFIPIIVKSAVHGPEYAVSEACNKMERRLFSATALFVEPVDVFGLMIMMMMMRKVFSKSKRKFLCRSHFRNTCVMPNEVMYMCVDYSLKRYEAPV